MKLILCSLLISGVALASKKENWVPKYQQKTIIKKISKTLQTSNIKSGMKIKMPSTALEALYMKKGKGAAFAKKLKTETLKLKQKAVPTLTKVMKSADFPDGNRWIATYMLGRIMGKKSAPFISKFSKHPNWMMRLASLKVLLHLDQKQYKGIYARLLEDKSLIVRHQALQNIKEFQLKGLAPYVWKMLYNKQNYVGMKGKRKRSNIIRDAIKLVGDLKFSEAKKPMLKMMKNKKYRDVYTELDYALSKVSQKSSPNGSMTEKKHFWNRELLKSTTI